MSRSLLALAFGATALLLAACDATQPPGSSDAGPPGASAGEADFLPIAPGTVWTYTYDYDSSCPSPPVFRDGVVTVSFLTETVEGATRRVAGQAHVDYREVIPYHIPLDIDTTDVDEVYAFEAVETEAGVVFESDELSRISFYPASLTTPIRRYHPASEDEVEIRVDLYHYVTLRAGAPPSVYSVSGSCRSNPRVSFAPVP